MNEKEMTPVDLVAKGGELVRLQNDQQVIIAMQKPRDEAIVYKNAIKELEVFPESAQSAIYGIPYKNDRGGTDMVEGPSIKAAMTLVRRWGNCNVSSKIVPGSETDDRVVVSGTFLDYETNMGITKEVSVSKMVYRKNVGKVVKLSADKFNVALAAGASKAMRNAILAGLPDYLVKAYCRKAKEMMTPKSKKDRETRVKEMYSAFESHGISKDILDKFMAINWPGMSSENLVDKMGGLYNALEDGTIKADYFTSEIPPKESDSEGKAVMSELTGETKGDK